MFAKGRKVVYPVYGPGKITDIYFEQIGNIKKEYYQIEFLNTNLSISVPVDEAETFGLRYPYSEKEIRKILKAVDQKQIKITQSLTENIEEIYHEKIKRGGLDDALEIVKIMRGIEKKKEKQNKKLSSSENERLRSALNFVKSEITLVIGKSICDKFQLLSE